MDPTITAAAARLRRVYAGEYLLEIYPQEPGLPEEEAVRKAGSDMSVDEHTLARAWLDQQDAAPTRTTGTSR